MVVTQVGTLIASHGGQLLAEKLFELLFKSKPNVPLEKLDSNYEIKEALKIISQHLPNSVNIAQGLSQISLNIQDENAKFIHELLNKADGTDKDIIIAAINSNKMIAQENTKGFWKAISLVGSVAVTGLVGLIAILANAQIEGDKRATEKYKIDNEKKPFWYK